MHQSVRGADANTAVLILEQLDERRDDLLRSGISPAHDVRTIVAVLAQQCLWNRHTSVEPFEFGEAETWIAEEWH